MNLNSPIRGYRWTLLRLNAELQAKNEALRQLEAQDDTTDSMDTRGY